MSAEKRTEGRLRSLQEHLRKEIPLLDGIVADFRTLDRITRRIGYFDKEQSYTYRMPWWPLISVLGTYSSGKSAFINYLLDYHLQATGNQAVDDKFTVVCYTTDKEVRVLPGLSLDADPRFPLYKISQAIDKVSRGEGRHIDNYLQLKTCPSEALRGRILIDSPGFDADAQRASTLQITDHIIELSDLVLVFFDARHPEVGSMTRTLEHLVRNTISRGDASKFLYVLNQMDNTAREDNPEEVFAAWQRALSQHGLTAGCCFAIYNPELAVPIEDDTVRKRLERRREDGYRAITGRMGQVGIERAYRIVGMLRDSAVNLEQEIVPEVARFARQWRKATLVLDGLVFGSLLLLLAALTIWPGYLDGRAVNSTFKTLLDQNRYVILVVVGAGLLAVGYVHSRLRRRAAAWVVRRRLARINDPVAKANYGRAYRKNSCWYRSIFQRRPTGWNRRNRRLLAKLLESADEAIRRLNDAYTSPSGAAPIVESATSEVADEQENPSAN
jgi:hypothetical protein